jgi:hypothetical protein
MDSGLHPGGTLSRQHTGGLRIAAIAEDLALPLDEGAKKTSFKLIQALREHGASVPVFTRGGNGFLGDTHSLPDNRLLLGSSFAHELKGLLPQAMLYLPASSGTLGAFVRAAMLKRQASGIPLALLNLQYRELPAAARYLGLYRQADIVFTQSPASAEVFRSIGCKPILLPGAVDHEVFRPVSAQEKSRLRSQHGFREADRIILHVGHCNRERNVQVLAQLAGRGFQPVLIASTSTSVDGELLAGLRQAGVRVITEFVEAVEHFYQLADCYLFPVFQATEAIDAPLSLLEAMACNLPVVSTRFGALPSLVEPGHGLYYAGSDAEIVELLGRAMEEPACATSEKVSPYSWHRAASTILQVLQERVCL